MLLALALSLAVERGPAFTTLLCPWFATVISRHALRCTCCALHHVLLISKRLDGGNRMGMEVFALGNLLGVAYALQLVGGVADHSAYRVHQPHHDAGRPVDSWAHPFPTAPCPLRPRWRWRAVHRCAIAGAVHLGTQARHAMLAGACALLFLAMVVTLFYGMRSTKDMAEMTVFALIAGICGLNTAKLVMIPPGLPALDMNSGFQTVSLCHSVPGQRCCRPALWLAAPPDRCDAPPFRRTLTGSAGKWAGKLRCIACARRQR